MSTRASLVTAFAVALGLAASSASVGAWSNGSRLTLLTFSGPVALPGVTLAPGTYAFDVFDSDSSANVVRVRDKSRSRTYFLGMTLRVDRPANMSADGRVSIGEAPRGGVAPIVAWYPGDGTGHRFLYR